MTASPPPRALRSGTPEEAGLDPARLARIQAAAREWVDSGITPSLCVLVARRGVVALHEAFGVLGDPEARSLRTDAIFPVASFTKSHTAAAILHLVDDGLVGLNRAAADYLPEMSGPGMREVLVADLLTHTSGIDDARVVVDAAARADGARDAGPGQHPLHAALVKATARAPLARPPGREMRYASVTYALLAEIVRRVSGRPLGRFLAEEIFHPLGMRDTALGRSSLDPDRLVVRPLREGTPPPPFDLVPSFEEAAEVFAGGMGVLSTALDAARFAQMLMNGGTLGGARVLSEAAAAAMTRAQIPPGVPAVWSAARKDGTRVDVPVRGGSYGYGVFLFDGDRTLNMNGSLMSPATFGHSGGTGCVWWADPTRELVGVYLSVMPAWRPNGTYLYSGDLFMNLAQAAALPK